VQVLPISWSNISTKNKFMGSIPLSLHRRGRWNLARRSAYEPNFTPIGATCVPAGWKTSKSVKYRRLCWRNAAGNDRFTALTGRRVPRATRS